MASEVQLATQAEIETRVGYKLTSKHVMALLPGNELWHRCEDGVWERYPDYPNNTK